MNTPLHSEPKLPIFANASMGTQIAVLFTAFLLLITVTSFIAQAIGVTAPGASRSVILVGNVLQCLLAFCLPAAITAYLCGPSPLRWIGVGVSAPVRSYIGMILLLALSIPALNQIIYWNEQMTFPDSLHGLEVSLRQFEDAAAASSQTLLTGTSVWTLISGVLIIGCLTGFSEEIFFRGALQSILSRSMSRHAAVWISAFIFSFIHFQFFGFVPRLLLGAFFGYLFAATGSIWLNATAHAVNNSIVVVSYWIAQRCGTDISSSMWGVAADGFPWLALGSALLVAAVIVLFRNRLFPDKSWQRKQTAHSAK